MTPLVAYLLLFVAVGTGFIFVHLLAGKFIRPNRPGAEKRTIYECGEPTVGSAWIQFDLRYYVVALLFVIFDVEVAFFFPWAVVFGPLNDLAHEPDPDRRAAIVREHLLEAYPLPPLPGHEAVGTISQDTAWSWAWIAFTDIGVFFGVLLMGFAYLWRRGDIDWVRSVTHGAASTDPELAAAVPPSRDKSELATATATAETR